MALVNPNSLESWVRTCASLANPAHGVDLSVGGRLQYPEFVKSLFIKAVAGNQGRSQRSRSGRRRYLIHAVIGNFAQGCTTVIIIEKAALGSPEFCIMQTPHLD